KRVRACAGPKGCGSQRDKGSLPTSRRYGDRLITWIRVIGSRPVNDGKRTIHCFALTQFQTPADRKAKARCIREICGTRWYEADFIQSELLPQIDLDPFLDLRLRGDLTMETIAGARADARGG